MGDRVIGHDTVKGKLTSLSPDKRSKYMVILLNLSL